MNIVQLQNITFLTGKKLDVFQHIQECIQLDKKVWITTVNALMFLEYLKNNIYSQAIEKASFSVPDGIGVVKYLKKNGYKTDRCPGIETMDFLCGFASQKKYTVYLLGSRRETVSAAAKKLTEKYGITIAGFHDGYFSSSEDTDIVNDINSKNADLVFVGMGIPKQEEFILRNFDYLNVKAIMGVGGSIDVFAGQVKRAPVFFQKLGMEWLFRMLEDPKRFRKLPDLINFYIKVYLPRGGVSK